MQLCQTLDLLLVFHIFSSKEHKNMNQSATPNMLIIILKYLRLYFWKLDWNTHLESLLVLSWLLIWCSLFPLWFLVVLEVFSNFKDLIISPSGSVVSWTFLSFLLPILSWDLLQIFIFFSQWGMKTPSLSWLLMLHFFGYLLTTVSSSYCNGYKAKFTSLLQSCITSCKIRNFTVIIQRSQATPRTGLAVDPDPK